eukprot:3915708-Rhodomonas_salina.1
MSGTAIEFITAGLYRPTPLATPCPVLPYDMAGGIALRPRYVMSGTEIAYAAGPATPYKRPHGEIKEKSQRSWYRSYGG